MCETGVLLGYNCASKRVRRFPLGRDRSPHFRHGGHLSRRRAAFVFRPSLTYIYSGLVAGFGSKRRFTIWRYGQIRDEFEVMGRITLMFPMAESLTSRVLFGKFVQRGLLTRILKVNPRPALACMIQICFCWLTVIFSTI